MKFFFFFFFFFLKIRIVDHFLCCAFFFFFFFFLVAKPQFSLFRNNMATNALEELKKHTIVVADTGKEEKGARIL